VSSSISVVDAAPRPLAVVRVTTVLSRWPREFAHTLDKVYAAVKAGRIKQSGHNVMVYRPRGDGLVDIECGIETAASFDPVGEVVYSQTPSGIAVSMTHVGLYDKLRVSYDAMTAWSRANNHRLSGVCWEIYGDWEDDPAKLRTDLHLLIAT
jgi:effector-binding domain-containing protein